MANTHSPEYCLRVRQPDGSWFFDVETPMTKKEAEYESKKNRILFGVMCQIWNLKEALEVSKAAGDKQ